MAATHQQNTNGHQSPRIIINETFHDHSWTFGVIHVESGWEMLTNL